jgi:hypothetical protein
MKHCMLVLLALTVGCGGSAQVGTEDASPEEDSAAVDGGPAMEAAPGLTCAPVEAGYENQPDSGCVLSIVDAPGGAWRLCCP